MYSSFCFSAQSFLNSNKRANPDSLKYNFRKKKKKVISFTGIACNLFIVYAARAVRYRMQKLCFMKLPCGPKPSVTRAEDSCQCSVREGEPHWPLPSASQPLLCVRPSLCPLMLSHSPHCDSVSMSSCPSYKLSRAKVSILLLFCAAAAALLLLLNDDSPTRSSNHLLSTPFSAQIFDLHLF